jgi:hypothetical protein
VDAIVGDGVCKTLLLLSIADDEVFIVVTSANFPDFARDISLLKPMGDS